MSTEQAKLEYITSAELMEMQLPPIKYTVEEILPAGLTVFAGAPKVGKSLFVLKLCMAVAKGENFWCWMGQIDKLRQQLELCKKKEL